jgi:hypothetical protein
VGEQCILLLAYPVEEVGVDALGQGVSRLGGLKKVRQAVVKRTVARNGLIIV